MKKYFLKDLSEDEIGKLAARPAIRHEVIFPKVQGILNDIKENGLPAALGYSKMFDGSEDGDILVKPEEYEQAEKEIEPELKSAISDAAMNILEFHKKQIPQVYDTEIIKGVKCRREFRAIENVGLYIPGGTAVLPSTMLMLGIPAKLAGCKRVVVCSPVKEKKVNNALLFAAKKCGINEFYKIGGAQAIALMTYGCREISKVNKIFGPGNQYVTAAKMLVSIDPSGCAIDMPAGPSEVLIIADENSNPEFIAADLLSQAEHGSDSQVVLVSTSGDMVDNVRSEIEKQLKELPRKDFASSALSSSFALITVSIEEALEFSNLYAPEHLILHLQNSEVYREAIINAGSVFLGEYSPESAGDYASGTNHSLPTYGYAKSYSGVSVESFMKSISFQQLSRRGLAKIAKTVETLAEAESLFAHKNAVSLRLKK